MPAKKKKPAAGKSRKKQARGRRAPGGGLLRRLLLLGIFGGFVAFGALVLAYSWAASGLPDIEDTEALLPEVTRVYSRQGRPIAEFYRQRRRAVTREEIPDVLVHAFLSAEDADFYQHEGLDYFGMLRALYNSVRAGRVTGSGSTITQQLVKNLLFEGTGRLDVEALEFRPDDPMVARVERKAKEIILARRLEHSLGKDDILTLYLNLVYFAHGRYGVQEASRFYWGKDVRRIDLAEAAMLAGIVQSPERMSPRKHPERAKRRRAYVLGQMADKGYITEAEAAAAEARPFALPPRPQDTDPDAGWFVARVARQVRAQLGDAALLEGGLDIHTTYDDVRQRAAARAVRDGLAAVDARQKNLEREGYAKDGKAWRRKRAKALKHKPPPFGPSMPARITEVGKERLLVDVGVGTARVRAKHAARWRPDGKWAWGVGDIIRVTLRADGPRHPAVMHAEVAMGPQAALVALDPTTGEVLAHVGGERFDAAPFDRATAARRQPGSTFKPFVWGAAIAGRRYTAASVVLDTPETFRIYKGRWWKPGNYTQTFEGPMTLRTALAKSKNNIAVKLAADVGTASVQALARAAGVTSPMVDDLTLALGSAEVTPMELARAYATIAAGGTRTTPRLIERIEGARQPVESDLTRHPPPEPGAVDPAVAYVVRSVMRSVVTSGSGRALAKLPREVVGKTGTTNNARDTWFAALLPEVVVVAWVGHDDQRPVGRKETGGRTAAPIVRQYLEAVEQDGPDWPPPPAGIESLRVAINVESGRVYRARAGNDEAQLEHFLEGTAPREREPEAGEVAADDFYRAELAGGGDEPIAVRPLAPAPIAPVTAAPAAAAPVTPAPAAEVEPAPMAPVAPAAPARFDPPAGGDPQPGIDPEDLPE